MRFTGVVCALAAVLLNSGCAHRPPHEEASDPLEPVNRAIYTFNDKADRYAIKPIAQGYEKVVPKPVRNGVNHFFSNLKEPTVVANDLLQGKLHQAASDTARFMLNSVFGVAGVFDVATSMGHPAHNEDFGQTLGKWGLGEGWYLVLPLLGPSNVRDGSGLLVDNRLDFVTRHNEVRERNAAIVLRGIDLRAQLLAASKVRDTAALDPYLYTREAYRQLRWNRLYDGNAPLPEFNGEFEDEEFDRP